MPLDYLITDVVARGPEIIVKVSFSDPTEKAGGDLETAEFAYPGDAWDETTFRADLQAEAQRIEADANTALKLAAQVALKVASVLVNEKGTTK